LLRPGLGRIRFVAKDPGT